MTEINFEDEYNKLKYIINSGKIDDYIFKDLYRFFEIYRDLLISIFPKDKFLMIVYTGI